MQRYNYNSGKTFTSPNGRKAIFAVVAFLAVFGLWKLASRGSPMALDNSYYSSGAFIQHHMDATPQFETESVFYQSNASSHTANPE